MGPLQAVADVVDLVWDDTGPVMTIDRPTPAGVWNELWWYRSPSSVNIMFWLGAGEHELGDHMELAELAGATDYLCDWESTLTNHAENKTYHMQFGRNRWRSNVTELAAEYGVAVPHMHRIIKREVWT